MRNPDDPLILYYQPAFFCSFDTTSRQPLPGEGAWQCDSNIEPMIKIWLQHPAELKTPYDPHRSRPLDLTRTPSRISDWSKVIADDNAHSPTFGFSTIGPLFPHAYGAAGVYLSPPAYAAVQSNELGQEQVRQDANETRTPSVQPIACDETALVRRPAGATSNDDLLRYHGFKGLQLMSTPKPGSKLGLWVVYHPGTFTCMDWRTPRKIFIRDITVFWEHSGCITKADNVDTDDALYLEQDYAIYTAQLDVPKKPSGAGERGSILALGAAKAPPSSGVAAAGGPAPPPRILNVMARSVSGEVKKIYNKLKSAYLLFIEEGETLVDALSGYLSKYPTARFDSLDLIGHSRSRDTILKLGELALTSRTADEQFGRLSDLGILEQLGIKRIRLLGCRTACHAHGQQTARTIREYFPQLEVWAARADLFSVHFDKDGFCKAATVLLADADVITSTGPGDIPPGEDYPADPPDDSDQRDTETRVNSAKPTPNEFSLATLSDPNAAIMSAKNGYIYWCLSHQHFEGLLRILYAASPIKDNPLRRADYEIFVATSLEPTSIADFRSFDLIVDDGPPRVRTYADGQAYAFLFRVDKQAIIKAFNDWDIYLSKACHPPSSYPGTTSK